MILKNKMKCSTFSFVLQYKSNVVKSESTKNRCFWHRVFCVLLDKVCFLECLVGAVLCDGAHCFCGDSHHDGLPELCDKDSLLLEIGLATYLSARIKLRRTSAVAVSSTNL